MEVLPWRGDDRDIMTKKICILGLGYIGLPMAAVLARHDLQIIGVDINATHHRAARRGIVTGVATPISLGRTMASWEIVISDEDGKRVCTSRISCLIRDAAPGA